MPTPKPAAPHGAFGERRTPKPVRRPESDLRTVNRYAYFYAERADGWNISGTGNAWLSVNPAAVFSQCAFDDADDGQWVDFYELDFSAIPAGFADFDTVVQFFDNPGFPRVQVTAQGYYDGEMVDYGPLVEPG